MATYTPYLGIEKLEQGQAGAHVIVNEGFDNFDRAIAGLLTIDVNARGEGPFITLSGGESTNMILLVKNSPSAVTLTVQKVPKMWVVMNQTGVDVTVTTSGQANPPTVFSLSARVFVCDGVSVYGA